MADKKTNIAPTSPATAVPVAPQTAKAPTAATPTFTLDAPLRWKAANSVEQKVLENLQGNILKGHGRDHTANIFFQFGADKVKSRRALRQLGNFHVTSAYKQLLSTQAFKEHGADGGTFCAAFISAKGYRSLGLTFKTPAHNTAFDAGMKDPASLAKLGDPKVSKWETEFQKDFDGMVLVADDDTVRGAVEAAKVVKLLKDGGCTIVKKQMGKALRNSVGNGLEHFGYVDGRSQPLMLVEDIESESRDEGIVRWDPTSALSKALVPDPLAGDAAGLSFGSFFIFRKLEEKVRDFKSKEQDLADALNLTGPDQRELAGALLVGRFEDGTPVTLSDEGRGSKAPPNDFNYNNDTTGSRCPFHAHIRKTNPRGSGGFNQDLAAEQAHIMPRRGITYEDTPREVHPDTLPASSSRQDFLDNVAPSLPEGGLGLLFMAYNAKLEEQFVFTQSSWANSPGFPQVPPTVPSHPAGLDGVIGQPAKPADEHFYRSHWDEPASASIGFKGFNGFVHMKGGEYFFAPSLQFLRNL